MHQRGGKSVTGSEARAVILDTPSFNEWIIDPSLVNNQDSRLAIHPLKRIPQKECWTSSGYSSQSPPLSSCYTACCTTTNSGIILSGSDEANRARDEIEKNRGVAGRIVEEAESIPKPIWPCNPGTNAVIIDRGDAEEKAKRGDDGRDEEIRRGRCGNPRNCLVGRNVLLELSKNLNSVIEATNEEILGDISITIATSEPWLVCQRLSCSTSSSTDSTSASSSLSSSSSLSASDGESSVNPVNLRLYGKPKWLNYDGKKTHIYLVPPHNCPNVAHYESQCASGTMAAGRTRIDGKLNESRIGNAEPIYTTVDGISDESGSSYEAISSGLVRDPSGQKKNETSSKIFHRHPDFTLDGNRAERLGRAIARAKRKRQWCRVLTAIFGLVFFILSVVVVSLSVTRGRKIFGSM